MIAIVKIIRFRENSCGSGCRLGAPCSLSAALTSLQSKFNISLHVRETYKIYIYIYFIYIYIYATSLVNWKLTRVVFKHKKWSPRGSTIQCKIKGGSQITSDSEFHLYKVVQKHSFPEKTKIIDWKAKLEKKQAKLEISFALPKVNQPGRSHNVAGDSSASSLVVVSFSESYVFVAKKTKFRPVPTYFL